MKLMPTAHLTVSGETGSRQPYADKCGDQMIQQSGNEDAGDYRVFLGETCGKEKGEQLRFIADFGNGNAQY